MTLSWIRRKIATQLFKLVDAFERLVERIDAPRCDDCGAVLADNERGATCEHCRRFERENLPRAGEWLPGKFPTTEMNEKVYSFPISFTWSGPTIEHELESHGVLWGVLKHPDTPEAQLDCEHCTPARES